MKTKSIPTKTAEEVRADFFRRGVSVRSWALKNNFSPYTVANVVCGRSKFRRGEAHRVAVVLGMKQGSIEQEEVTQ